MDRALRDAATAALDALGVGSADSVLVVHNGAQRGIAQALAAAAEGRAVLRLLQYPEGRRHGEEPPPDVAAAMLGPSVVLAPTTCSLSHTAARIVATATGARIATLPGITEDIFRRVLAVDHEQLRRVGLELAARLTPARECRITTELGTDLRLDLSGRDGRSDDGVLREAGAMGNLPAGEGYISPVEHHGEGVVVFDGSIATYGLLAEPLRVSLAGGRIVDADGPAAGWLLQTLDAGGEHGRSIAELGIGTNPRAGVHGNILEDEKAIGTLHLAFGSSAGIGGVNQAAVHIDAVVRAPTIELDGDPLPLDALPR